MNSKLIRPTLVTAALLAMPVAAIADDWNWSVTPYVWAAGITADVAINDQEVLGGEVDFSDLLDDTDGAFMLHVEARRDRIGVFGDLVYTDLGKEPRFYDALGLTIEAEADPETTIVDLGGVYYPGGDGAGFGVHYGIRLLDVDQEIDIFAPGGVAADRRIVDVSETFLDGLVGLRYTSEFADNWTFAISGDVSTGDTDSTWSAQAVFGYKVGSSDQNQIRFGYRYLAIELEQDDRLAEVETDIAMSGPMVGFTFGF
jgi:hypothetical protein